MDVEGAREAVVETSRKLVDAGLLVGTWGNVSIRVDRQTMVVTPTGMAYTCCLVLEKACKAFVEGEFLGGATSIGRFEAHLLHQYYLRKYSKIDRKR